jgi:transcriptional regulator with XRE-family HTH domain
LVYNAAMTAGDRIREARARAGLTVRQLAHLLSVSPAMIAHWEAGNRPVTAKRLAQIAELTLTDPTQLLWNAKGDAIEPPLTEQDEIELIRAYRKLSDRQRKNLLKLVKVSVGVHREMQHQSEPA